MTIAISSHRTRRAECALYEIDPRTGATVEIFYADRAVAQSFGGSAAGWYWRYRLTDRSPGAASGPFLVCLDAYRDAGRWVAQ
jgi:hypothetical protein